MLEVVRAVLRRFGGRELARHGPDMLLDNSKARQRHIDARLRALDVRIHNRARSDHKGA